MGSTVMPVRVAHFFCRRGGACLRWIRSGRPEQSPEMETRQYVVSLTTFGVMRARRPSERARNAMPSAQGRRSWAIS
jgi:hypothetical protein